MRRPLRTISRARLRSIPRRSQPATVSRNRALQSSEEEFNCADVFGTSQGTVPCGARPNIERHANCWVLRTEGVMSLVRLLGFTTLGCGCVVGRYREVATSREVTYVEEKGNSCGSHGHRRNHTIAAERLPPSPLGFSGLAAQTSPPPAP